MAKTIMIGNYKGGSGKTQTALEMAYWLACRDKRVFAVDLDHQANFTKVLSKGHLTGKRSLPEILIAGDQVTPDDVSTSLVNKTGCHIDYIASSLAAGRLEKKLPDDTPKEYVLKDALTPIKDYYDYIIVDTPPSAELITTCALIACDSILITSQAAVFSSEGVYKLMRVIDKVKSFPRMNPGLEVLGILITMFEETIDCRQTVTDLQRSFESLIIQPVIRKCTKVKESNRHFSFIQTYAPGSTSANDYKQAFNSIFEPELEL